MTLICVVKAPRLSFFALPQRQGRISFQNNFNLLLCVIRRIDDFMFIVQTFSLKFNRLSTTVRRNDKFTRKMSSLDSVRLLIATKFGQTYRKNRFFVNEILRNINAYRLTATVFHNWCNLPVVELFIPSHARWVWEHLSRLLTTRINQVKVTPSLLLSRYFDLTRQARHKYSRAFHEQ